MKLATIGEVRQPYDDTEPEVHLWIGVIAQALNDAAYIDPHPERPISSASGDAKRREMRTEQMRARVWLRGKTRDFREVCAMAGVDPTLVKRIHKDMIRGQEA